MRTHEARTRRFSVHHDGITISVSRGGRGRPLLFCPGLNSTQAHLHRLIELLRDDFDVVTFDLRGHGRSSAAGEYSFRAFLGDLGAVVAALEPLDLPSAPMLVGYSMGADLVVHYAAGHPHAAAGLVLIDGANPVPEPFITDEARSEFRSMWDALASAQQAALDEEAKVVLDGREIFDLNVEIDALRSRILDEYRRIDLPISVVMSTAMAGESGHPYEQRLNRNWRAGVARLVLEHPHIATHRVEGDHQLVVTHAAEIARIIRGAPDSRLRAGTAAP